MPAWKATALPSADGMVFEDAGKILNRDPIVKTAPGIGPGTYVLTITCDGGGKAFFEVSLDGARLTEAGAACNGSRETARIKVPAAGTLQISTSSVDAPAHLRLPAGARGVAAGARPRTGAVTCARGPGR